MKWKFRVFQFPGAGSLLSIYFIQCFRWLSLAHKPNTEKLFVLFKHMSLFKEICLTSLKHFLPLFFFYYTTRDLWKCMGTVIYITKMFHWMLSNQVLWVHKKKHLTCNVAQTFVCMNHRGILLKCRFSFLTSGVEPEFISNKAFRCYKCCWTLN